MSRPDHVTIPEIRAVLDDIRLRFDPGDSDVADAYLRDVPRLLGELDRLRKLAEAAGRWYAVTTRTPTAVEQIGADFALVDAWEAFEGAPEVKR